MEETKKDKDGHDTTTTWTTITIHLRVWCKTNKEIKSTNSFDGSIPKVFCPAEKPSHQFLPQLNEISSLNNTLQSSKLLLLLLFVSHEISFSFKLSFFLNALVLVFLPRRQENYWELRLEKSTLYSFNCGSYPLNCMGKD